LSEIICKTTCNWGERFNFPTKAIIDKMVASGGMLDTVTILETTSKMVQDVISTSLCPMVSDLTGLIGLLKLPSPL
jgi:hypothetical protein